MIREAMEFLQEKIEASTETEIIKLPGDPADIHYAVDRKTGELKRMQNEVGPRQFKAATIFEFTEMIAHFLDTGATDPVKKAVVFIDQAGAQAISNESGRRDEGATIEYGFSEPMRKLQELAQNTKPFKQRDLLWMLRTTMADIPTTPRDLLAQVRVVKFGQAADGKSEIKPASVSISNSVLASMSGVAADFPEEISFQIPVFLDLPDDKGQPFDAEIRCALGINPDKQEFEIKPLPGEIEIAIREAQEWLKAVILRLTNSEAVEVFIGSPTAT